MHEAFNHFSKKVAQLTGAPITFSLALLTIIVWLITGPVFGFSNTWQLVINTATTIVTFLMVFLIQNSQNRDSKAVHLKLDELIRSQKSARNSLLELENMTDEELENLEKDFKKLYDMELSKRHGRMLA